MKKILQRINFLKEYTVNELIDVFLQKEYIENSKITDSTKRHANNTLKIIKSYFDNDMTLKELNYERIEDFKGKLRNRYSNSNSKIMFSMFKRYANFLNLNGYIKTELKFKKILSSQPYPENHYVSDKQWANFKRNVKNQLEVDPNKLCHDLGKKHKNATYKLYLCASFLLYSGIRLQELKRIKWTDWNREKATLKISSFCLNKGRTRTIQLSKQACDILKQFPKYCNEYISPYNIKNEHQIGAAFSYFFRKTKTRQHNRFKLSSLRKTFITNALKSGLSLEHVSKYVGHSSSQVTSQYYSSSTELCVDDKFKQLEIKL